MKRASGWGRTWVTVAVIVPSSHTVCISHSAASGKSLELCFRRNSFRSSRFTSGGFFASSRFSSNSAPFVVFTISSFGASHGFIVEATVFLDLVSGTLRASSSTSAKISGSGCASSCKSLELFCGCLSFSADGFAFRASGTIIDTCEIVFVRGSSVGSGVFAGLVA